MSIMGVVALVFVMASVMMLVRVFRRQSSSKNTDTFFVDDHGRILVVRVHEGGLIEVHLSDGEGGTVALARSTRRDLAGFNGVSPFIMGHTNMEKMEEMAKDCPLHAEKVTHRPRRGTDPRG